MKKLICFSALFFALTFCFATTSTAPESSCPTPQNVTVVAKSSGSISFDWNGCDGCGQTFEVYFVINGNASATYTVSSSEISFSGLGAGTYEFHFRQVCASGTSTDYIITEEVLIG